MNSTFGAIGKAKGIEMTEKAVSKNSNFCVSVKKNRQSMTERGYCCYYLEYCSKTNHVAIKGVIKGAKYENVFGLVAYQKHADLFLAPHKICRSPNL